MPVAVTSSETAQQRNLENSLGVHRPRYSQRSGGNSRPNDVTRRNNQSWTQRVTVLSIPPSSPAEPPRALERDRVTMLFMPSSSLNDAELGIPNQDPFARPRSHRSFPTRSLSSDRPMPPPEVRATATFRSSIVCRSNDDPPNSTEVPKDDLLKDTLVTVKIPRKRIVKRASRWIRFQLWFNTYRKFFTTVLTFNVFGLILAATGVWSYPRDYTGAFILGNLYIAILVRNELFGRFLYLFVNMLFAKWSPLGFRLACTSALQHLGGIHSGCAISGFIWFVFRVVILFINHSNIDDAIIAMGVVTNVVIGLSIISAFPWVRNRHHNVFERHHRFLGWAGLIFTWIFVILGDSHDSETHTWNRRSILRQQDFWFAMGMTVFILIPWLTVREVEVHVEIPSPKVAVLRFKRGMQQGLLTRISRSAILEYHAFGIISEGRYSDVHYLICGVQGDFTKSLVESPPTRIWTRELKFAGVSNTSTLYKRGIRVCTGTGLGAALSTCLQTNENSHWKNPDWYMIWIGSDQEKTFGPTISGLIHRNLGPERVTLWDSKKRGDRLRLNACLGGRPDVMKLIKDAYHSWGAEVVFITSNLQGNTEMMEGCKEAGIPAFGTLWDF
ncbi:hypothetical protein K443DRAFT_127733 [Laccaria amethystina LaAM-08-1]|uniref:Non-ribosomal peptide synthetase n=1 Tax=Laccaria amethystina LaAM-08-1 TaxID=1095629 RepID=A0A0C9Y5M9_9AGAR|nr:hypothetical protein K443DRAFT_127733 [Laccaria amethystina LaAM-08-1]